MLINHSEEHSHMETHIRYGESWFVSEEFDASFAGTWFFFWSENGGSYLQLKLRRISETKGRCRKYESFAVVEHTSNP